MKKLIFLLTVCCSFLMTGLVAAADVDYSIPLYMGKLTLNSDNTATFQQTVVYDFDSDYNGQYVTLGSAGNVPKGFRIDNQPKVEAYEMTDSKQLKSRNVETSVEKLSDGYRVKVYNKGNDGDRVVLSLQWKLYHMTTVYSDVAELNWIPISDWDAKLGRVMLTVRGPSSHSKNSKLYAHTGYFKKQPTITQKDGAYQVKLEDGLATGKKLELHGYWDRSAFSVAQDQSGKRRSSIHAQEARIVRKGSFFRTLLAVILPAVALILLLISFILYLVWKASIKQGRLSKSQHLFSPPADFSPLVLTRYVYGLTVKELSPNVKSKEYGIGFKELIQASLLDLIDQKKLVISEDKKSFQLPDPNKLEPYEKALLTFIYGNGSMPIDGAFEDYKTDKRIFKEGSESKVRSRGDRILKRYDKRLRNLDKTVSKKIDSLRLENIRRDKTKQEEGLLVAAYLVTILAFLFAIIVGVFCLFKAYWTGLGLNIIPLLLAVILFFIYSKKEKYYKVTGLLTPEGLAVKQGWESFKNMIRDIKTFETAELDSVVVWNRILVYATIYGYAEQVQKYLQVRNIELDNPQMTAYMATNPGYYMGVSTHHLASYTSTATSASNFSVSSGGGGGGFSGGGGGGGGGAF